MKAAVMKEGGGLEVRDMPEPPDPGPDQVKVKIAYCGICGSELHSLDPDCMSRTSRPPPSFITAAFITYIPPNIFLT